MLTYQDCLELKKGGFPHVFYIGSKYHKEGKPGATHTMISQEEEKQEDIYLIPTLSELIEACPRFIYSKVWETECNFELWANKNDWSAVYHWMDGTLHDEIKEAKGSSPEQAVKNLYIALHKK